MSKFVHKTESINSRNSTEIHVIRTRPVPQWNVRQVKDTNY